MVSKKENMFINFTSRQQAAGHRLSWDTHVLAMCNCLATLLVTFLEPQATMFSGKIKIKISYIIGFLARHDPIKIFSGPVQTRFFVIILYLVELNVQQSGEPDVDKRKIKVGFNMGY